MLTMVIDSGFYGSSYVANTLQCHWCGISLSNASSVTYLNGNLPVCDLCLIKANKRREHEI
jgi:phage FluMu protein Com